MIDQDRIENLYSICGGVFRTTVLLQKRIKELNRGAKRLVEGDFKSPIEVAAAEIEAGKIQLIEDNAENREAIRADAERRSGGQMMPPQVEVPIESSEDELERRIMSALAKEKNA